VPNAYYVRQQLQNIATSRNSVITFETFHAYTSHVITHTAKIRYDKQCIT